MIGCLTELFSHSASGAYPGPQGPDGVPAWVQNWVGSLTKSVEAEGKKLSSYACYVE